MIIKRKKYIELSNKVIRLETVVDDLTILNNTYKNEIKLLRTQISSLQTELAEFKKKENNKKILNEKVSPKPKKKSSSK